MKMNNDVSLRIKDRTQWENILFLQEFVNSNLLYVDYRDKFPDEFNYEPTKTYEFDITYFKRINGKFSESGGAQFIIDDNKIILRPFYPNQSFSISQREKISNIFL